jgi:hypothetical protein
MVSSVEFKYSIKNNPKKGIKMLDLKVQNLTEISEAGYEFELTLPGSGERTGAFVKVRGEQSKTARAYARKKYAEYRQREQVAKRKGREDEMSLEDAEDMAVETAVIRIISWRGVGEDGKEVPFTKDNAERILKENSWIREQVLENSNDLLNFQLQ